jgi:hypothetical protein
LVPTAVLKVKVIRYPLNRELGGPRGQSGHFGKEINLLLLLGIEPRFLDLPLHKLVIALTV